MVDANFAELYGVPTKRLNEQVKRNPQRFPDDFMFQLTDTEKQEVVANCDHLDKLASRLDELEQRIERKLETHDQTISGFIKTLRQMMTPQEPKK